MNKKIAKRLLGAAVVGLTSYFFISRLSSSWSDLSNRANLRLGIESLVAAFLFALAVAISGILWSRVLNQVSRRDKQDLVGYVDGVAVHSVAWLLKYIPGQVGSLIYKVKWGSEHKFSKKESVSAFAYENLFLTIASLQPFSLILILTPEVSSSMKLILVMLLSVSIILLCSQTIVVRFMKLATKRLRYDLDDMVTFSVTDSAKISLLYCIPRIINGLGIFLLAISLFSLGHGDVLPLVSAYAVAGIIGIYAIFVPSGIGVREGVFVALTSGILGVNEAILLSLVARFHATAADGILALTLIPRLANKNGKQA